MSINRETALKNAMLRTTRFDDIFSDKTGSIFKILELGEGYYKIFLSHSILSDDGKTIMGTTLIEVMGKQIISIKAATKDETYSISTNGDFMISNINLENVSVSIEYYDSFTLKVEEVDRHVGTTVISVSDTLTYIKDVHANNVRVNNLNVSKVQTPLLECNEIRLGAWRFYLDRDGDDNLVTIGQIPPDQTGG